MIIINILMKFGIRKVRTIDSNGLIILYRIDYYYCCI